MDALALELFLDTVEGRLAAALPAHLAASASAYAAGRAAPPSPTVAPRDAARIFEATRCGDSQLAARAVSLLRVVAPTVIEADSRVNDLRTGAVSWNAYATLCDARSDASVGFFGVPHRPLLQRLAGAPRTEPDGDTVPAKIEAWHAPSSPVRESDVRAIWTRLAKGIPVGALEIATTDTAHPRMFAIERGVRATIVVPTRLDSPAKMFAVLHELGHALLWLSPQAKDREWPRMIDEAAASYVAREMEHPINAWFDENAKAARHRRTLLAQRLDGVETWPVIDWECIAAKPPWALWHDPAMQAIYVAAEAVADELPTRMTGAELVEELAARATAIDAGFAGAIEPDLV